MKKENVREHDEFEVFLGLIQSLGYSVDTLSANDDGDWDIIYDFFFIATEEWEIDQISSSMDNILGIYFKSPKDFKTIEDYLLNLIGVQRD